MSDAKPLIEAKKNYHHGDLRGQLLEAVRQLVESHGPDGFSIAEACRLAGVSTAAPYKHFKDRDEILRGVVMLAMERMQADLQAAADAHPPGSLDRVVALGKSYVNFAHREPGVFRVMFGLTENHGDDPELTEMGECTFGIVIGVVADHLGLPPDSPEVNGRAYALWCSVHGHSFLSLDGKAEDTKITVNEDDYLRLVSASFLPPRR